jgi:AcrR family transcriptional regulator
MSPRTKEQFKSIRDEKVNLILQTALRLFAREGYASASVSLIAKEAGISKGLMYNYFKSKEELLGEIVIGGFRQFLDLLVIEDESNVKKQEIIDFVDGNVNLLKQNPEYFMLYFSLLFQPKVIDLFKDDFLRHFENIIGLMVNYYEKSGASNPYVKARYLLAVFDGVGMHYISDTEGFPLDEARDMLVELL